MTRLEQCLLDLMKLIAEIFGLFLLIAWRMPLWVKFFLLIPVVCMEFKWSDAILTWLSYLYLLAAVNVLCAIFLTCCSELQRKFTRLWKWPGGK